MELSRFMREPMVLFLAALFTVTAVVYFAIDDGSSLWDPAINPLYMGMAAAGFAAPLVAFRFYGTKSFEGKMWLLIAAGGVMWFLGELVWFHLEVVLVEEPFPSAADYFFLAGYAPMALAFIVKARYSKLPFDIKRMGLALVLVAAMAVPTMAFVVGPTMDDGTMTSTEKAYSAAYPLLDIALFAVAVLIAIYWGRTVSGGWYFIALAMVFRTFADVAQSYWAVQGASYPPQVDLLWVASFMFFALGALFQKRFHESFM